MFAKIISLFSKQPATVESLRADLKKVAERRRKLTRKAFTTAFGSLMYNSSYDAKIEALKAREAELSAILERLVASGSPF